MSSAYLEKHSNDFRAINDFRRLCGLAALVIDGKNDKEVSAILRRGIDELLKTGKYKASDGMERMMIDGVVRNTLMHLSDFNL